MIRISQEMEMNLAVKLDRTHLRVTSGAREVIDDASTTASGSTTVIILMWEFNLIMTKILKCLSDSFYLCTLQTCI